MFCSHMKQRLVSLLIIIVSFTVLCINVFAAITVTVLDGRVSLTDTANSISVSGDVVTITAKGGLLSQTTNKVTIYNSTDSTATLSFDYSASNYKSFSESSASGTCSALLNSGESTTISITGKRALSNNTATLTLSNFNLVEVAAESTVTLGSYASDFGNATVGGGTSATGNTTTAVALRASANAGTTFLGWIDADTNTIISTALSYDYKPVNDITVKPVFVGGTTPNACFKVGNYLFEDLKDADDFAKNASSKTIVLVNNGTLPSGSYTISSGNTLLIPFDSSNTLYTTEPGSVSGQDGFISTTVVPWVKPTAYRTLTMANGAKITVNGAISVSAKCYAPHSPTQGAGSPYGPCGYIKMNEGSSIIVSSGANLYAWGYIYGDGTITAKSGANVYENFQFNDWRGGSDVTRHNNNSEACGFFPLSQYYVQNIEASLTLETGAREYGYSAVHVAVLGAQGVPFNFFGTQEDNNAMFKLLSGSVTKRYDGTTDRLIIEVNGTMAISPVNVTLEGTTIQSQNFELPINGNITINVYSGSQVNIDQDIFMMPGSKLWIKSGAKCVFAEGQNAYAYDADQWGGYCGTGNAKLYPILYSPTKSYTRKAADLVDAEIRVDGELDASGGSIYTTTGGANIYSTGEGVVKTQSGTQTVTYQYQYENKYIEVAITPAKLKNGDGSYSETTNGTGIVTYTYDPDLGEWGGMAEVISNNDVKHRATTLAEAVAEYGTPADGKYIKMVHDSAVGANIEKTGTVLDLNGKNITGVVTVPAAVSNGDGTVTHGLYGMDSHTNGYQDAETDDPNGSIVLSGTPAAITVFNGTHDNDKATMFRYLAVKDAEDTEKGTSTWSFHRFNISVTDYYLEVLSTGDARIGFGATFRGDSVVKGKVTDTGFTVNDNDEWAGKSQLETVDGVDKLYYTIGTTVMGDNTAFAMLEFNNKDTQNSESRTVNFLTALQVYYDDTGTTQDHKNMIDSFMTKAGLKWPTA